MVRAWRSLPSAAGLEQGSHKTAAALTPLRCQVHLCGSVTWNRWLVLRCPQGAFSQGSDSPSLRRVWWRQPCTGSGLLLTSGEAAATRAAFALSEADIVGQRQHAQRLGAQMDALFEQEAKEGGAVGGA